MKQDKIFSKIQQVVDFAFDDAVADVFPDMIRRSVPGYETVISLLGVLANQYAQNNTRIYDLGCSLGAATLSIHQQTRTLDLEHICIDNSEAMVKRCESRLQRHMPAAHLELRCENIEKTGVLLEASQNLKAGLEKAPVDLKTLGGDLTSTELEMNSCVDGAVCTSFQSKHLWVMQNLIFLLFVWLDEDTPRSRRLFCIV